jgi:hypothetical protein
MNMKMTGGIFAVALIVGLGFTDVKAADDGTLSGSRLEQASGKDVTGPADPGVNPGQAQGFKIVQGEVLKMEGNTYLIRDETGKEVRLTVTKDSKVDKAFEVGDRIVAQVSDQGVATLIKKSEMPGESSSKPKADPSARPTP